MRYSILILFSFISFHLFSQNEVKYKWSGAITYQSAKVNAKMTDTSSTIRLLADDDSTFASPLYSTFYSVDSNTNYMVAMEIRHLNPLTKYFYAVESGGIIDSSADDVGSFTTFANGPFSYSFVLG
jgi:CDP-glycerol glycerophosphotransferase (TagB/SpsB family)